MWSTPAVHTWDAWVALQWRGALLRGLVPATQLLSASQERALWEMSLTELAGEHGDAVSLTQHAGALMNAAARATQSGLEAGMADGPEEALLVAALARVREFCEQRGLLSLRLTAADQLEFLSSVAPPLIVGQPRLTTLQQRLQRRHWPSATLLAAHTTQPVEPRLLRAADLQQELEACAAWCRIHVERNPSVRLLVLTACIDPSPGIQVELLWRSLAGALRVEDRERRRWLAREGGEPLAQQALIADAMAALTLCDAQQESSTRELVRLLHSPYFEFGSITETTALAHWLCRLGLAVFAGEHLPALLQQAVRTMPAAARFAEFLTALRGVTADSTHATTMEWATRFASALEAGRFAQVAPLDSRDLQRLLRWHELLDEFASLDAVLPPAAVAEALRRLLRLAGQGRHQAASGDVAVTFSDALGDPVAHYDGIWVLGMAEQRWPPAPRPEPWVPLADQRRAHWPEAGVTQRRAQAAWALQCWRHRTGDLVISHPAHEQDLHHRAPTLLGEAQHWQEVTPTSELATATGLALPAADQSLPALGEAERAVPLAGGAARLADQQDCAFRAQARWRLGADPPEMLSDGIPLWLRGRLLHALLHELWGLLRDQPALLALTAAEEAQLLRDCWRRAVKATRGTSWVTATTLAREQARTLRLCGQLLALERERAPFAVRDRERALGWQAQGVRLELRIDRVDTTDDGALLIDYKSGGSARSELHRQMRPLQLALYAAALAQSGEAPRAAALLNLDPAGPHFSGAAAPGNQLPAGLRALSEWDELQRDWQQQLMALVIEHLSGDATLTRDPQVCRRCHLPALCRRAADGDTEDEPGPADE